MALVSCTIYPLSVILLDVIKHSINDGNLGNNGHSIQPTSQAAMAEELPVATETGQLRSHPSGFRPKLPSGLGELNGWYESLYCRMLGNFFLP
jgi:hypothetical protein